MSGYHAKSHYVAAKSVQRGFTKASAIEFAPYAITFNTVASGLDDELKERGQNFCSGVSGARKRLPLPWPGSPVRNRQE